MSSIERFGYQGPPGAIFDVKGDMVLTEIEAKRNLLAEHDGGRRNRFFVRAALPVFSLFLMLSAACARGEANVGSVRTPDLPTATITSEIGESEVVRRNSPPARVTDPEAISFPENLQLPEGTSVVIGSCASDGRCSNYNFYWGPTHEVVLQEGEREYKMLHEICHAHQHWAINGGNHLANYDTDLESWYQTAEGQSFTDAVRGLPWPWTDSAVNGLEDFAWTCGFFYFDPHYLQDKSPERYMWAAENLP